MPCPSLSDKYIDDVLRLLAEFGEANQLQSVCVYLSAHYHVAHGDILRVGQQLLSFVSLIRLSLSLSLFLTVCQYYLSLTRELMTVNV